MLRADKIGVWATTMLVTAVNLCTVAARKLNICAHLFQRREGWGQPVYYLRVRRLRSTGILLSQGAHG